MILWARHSDRTQERTWRVADAGLVAAAALAASAALASPLLSLVALAIGVTGIFGFFGTFRAIPPSFLTGCAAAADIAMIVSIGNCGGLIRPSVVGWTREVIRRLHFWFRRHVLLLCGLLAVDHRTAFHRSDSRGKLAGASACREITFCGPVQRAVQKIHLHRCPESQGFRPSSSPQSTYATIT
jgi:hypothetical protein